jgi:PAS domain S-box-containing protein
MLKLRETRTASGRSVAGGDVPPLQLYLLGRFAATAQGRPLALSTRKDRALLAYLAMAEGRRYSRERLATMLWGEVEGDAKHSLRQSLSAISRAMGEELSAQVLWITRDEIGIDPLVVSVDAIRAKALLMSDAQEDLERAIAIYTGSLLDGLSHVSPTFDDWLTIEREQLAAAAITGNRRLLDLYAAAGAPERAIPAASRLVEMNPFQEGARQDLMLLYAECGHTHSAIAQYETYAALLRTELGVEPAETIKQIHQLLVEGDTPALRRRQTLPSRMRSVPDAGMDFLHRSVIALEQIPDCMIIGDLDGRIVGWNHHARSNFGYEKREVVGRKASFLYAPGADVSAELISKAVRFGRWSGVLRLFNKDGSSRLHKRTMTPLRDERGRIVGVFGVTRPLTRPVPGLSRPRRS